MSLLHCTQRGLANLCPAFPHTPHTQLPFVPPNRNKVVFRDAEGRDITRRGLVLAVANQDGGGHVDPTLKAAYAALSRQNSLGWRRVIDGKDEPAGPPHLDAVRQVAHEVLKTLIPNYSKKPRPSPTPQVQFAVTVTKAQSAGPQQVGRNDPCPCGSGRKYKKCHGAPKPT